MITCKDGHVMATGREPELLEDIGAIAAALAEDMGGLGWMAVMSSVAAGIETALDRMHEKEADNG